MWCGGCDLCGSRMEASYDPPRCLCGRVETEWDDRTEQPMRCSECLADDLEVAVCTGEAGLCDEPAPHHHLDGIDHLITMDERRLAALEVRHAR